MARAIKGLLLTPEQYIQAEERGECRHEYAGGFVYAQAGASGIHNLLALALATRLTTHLQGSLCRTYMADMKVRIKTWDLDLFYYPDVMVPCDPHTPHEYYEDKPKPLAGIFSNATKSKDRLEKLNAYFKLPSLEKYVLVEQHRLSVDVYRRTADGLELEKLEEGDALVLHSVGLTLPMRALYEDVLGLIGPAERQLS
jgi:Uma2 family endonuclease